MKKNSVEARVLPHNLESEQCVLGCVLIDQDASFNILSDVKEDDFYLESHKIICDNMIRIFNSNQPVDYVTLCDQLERVNMIDSVGGHDYLIMLTNIVPSAKNFNHYLEIVKQNSILRKLISASQEIIEYSFDGAEREKAITFAEESIFRIAEKETEGGLTHVGDSLKRVVEKFELIEKDKNAARGIPSGLYGLDRITNGFQKSDLILIAARPGFGKTSLGMNFITHAAINAKAKVAVFSLEMSKDQIMQRAICSVASVNMQRAIKGELSTKDWKVLLAAKEKLNEAQIYVDEGFSKTPAELIGKCRRLKREHGLDLVMIDYLQLMQSGSKSTNINRTQEISEITRALKMAARELEVPILLLSQLSRLPEGRANHRPMLSDLRESGSIEQDADMVLFIFKPEMYEDKKNETTSQDGINELIIAKNRNGPVDTIKMRWIGEITTFVNIEKDANAESLESAIPPEKTSKGEIEEVLDGSLNDIF